MEEIREREERISVGERMTEWWRGVAGDENIRRERK
jgi:hypothetical protein